MKLYACGTVPDEFHRSNVGPIEFYCSAPALRDDKPCTDQCGILEFEVKQTRVVRRSKIDISKCKTSTQLQIEERITVPLADKIVEAVLSETAGNEYLARSAVTRALAYFKLKARKARRMARKKK